MNTYQSEIESYRLCYVEQLTDCIYRVYFTSDFNNQWGDDWNDSPAESNAGEPYNDKTKLTSIIISFDWISDIFYGGKYASVEDLNKKIFPWIKYKEFVIQGGMTRQRFLNECAKYQENIELFVEV